MPVTKMPTARQCAKVSKVLTSDPFFSKKLGPKLISVQKPGGETEEYHEQVVAAAAYILNKGFDPLKASKMEILSDAGNMMDSYKSYLPSPETMAAAPRRETKAKPAAEKAAKPAKAAAHAETNGTPKRGRGRPRKNPDAPTPVTAEVKRGRGRPRKNAAAAPVVSEAPAPRKTRSTTPSRRGAPQAATKTTVIPIWSGIASNALVVQSMVKNHAPHESKILGLIDEVLERIQTKVRHGEKEAGQEITT